MIEPNDNFTINKSNLSGSKNKLKIDNSTTLSNYHGNVQANNKKIVNNIIIMCWIGIAVVIAGVVAAWTAGRDIGIVINAAGVITEGVSAIMLKIAKSEGDSKDKYFEILSDSEAQKEIREFINSIKDKETRSKCQEKYIDYITKNK